MAGIAKIKEIEARKRRLLAESESHRQTLAVEFRNLGPAIAAMECGYATIRTAAPYWKFASPLVAWALIRRRKKRSRKGLFLKSLAGLQLLWKGWRFLQRSR